MANIILRTATSWTEEQFNQLEKNGAEPSIIPALDQNKNFINMLVWRSSWKWNPCPSLTPFASIDIDAYGIQENTIWFVYATQKLTSISL